MLAAFLFRSSLGLFKNGSAVRASGRVDRDVRLTEGALLRGRSLGSLLLLANARCLVHCLNDAENNKGSDQEINDCGDKATICKYGRTSFPCFCNGRKRLIRLRQKNEQIAKIRSAKQA